MLATDSAATTRALHPSLVVHAELLEVATTASDTSDAMNEIADRTVAGAFEAMPADVRSRLLPLRDLILDVAEALPDTGTIEETLKWGEPSYVAKRGSTVRLGWQRGSPNRHGLYFHCQTRLVDTFREVYGETFRFEGKRAILFEPDEAVQETALRHCIEAALRYHRVKHLPLLGM